MADFSEIISRYQDHPTLASLRSSLKPGSNIQIKGIAGSSDAVICSALNKEGSFINIIVLHDKEEASYFFHDMRQLVADAAGVFMFPTSYKKPYQFEEIENANILQRAETLNAVNSFDGNDPLFVITYPEALTEKVINKRSLVDHTFSATIGDKLDAAFLTELMITYDFEKTDFVFEAGQFAVRGGIIDIYSFAYELPFRIELFGDEIESIREFDPESQLSNKDLDQINIIPDVQTKMLTEERQSLLSYIPAESLFWLKDYREVIDIMNKGFDKASEEFDSIMALSGNTQVILNPSDLYDSGDVFLNEVEKFTKIEFGKRYYLPNSTVLQFDIKPQPHFHKKFDLLADNLTELQSKGYSNFLLADSFQQLERLQTIFEEIDTTIEFEGINISLKGGFIDEALNIACYTDHQIFDKFHRAKTKERFTKKKAITLKELRELKTGDFVVHVDHGVGRFAGLDTVDVGGNKQDAIRLVYRDDDLLYLSIHSLHKISKYSGKEGGPPSVNKLGSQEWENKKKKVKKKVKDIAKDLISLYAKRKSAPGFAFPEDNFLQAELESSFMYEDTPDQGSATAAVKKDMEQAHPMDRLVCGDVGFGKTEIAIRAAFKAVNSGKQVAVLVPTTILAFQHFHTFSERLKNFPIVVDYINRFRSTKEINEIKKELKEGKIDILIGTHRLVNKDMEFKDLGLMVIDEEQKFGVTVKERLKKMRVDVDAVTLTATPIPRTLHFSLMGARDLSIISTPPPNRRPVTTELQEFNEEMIRDAVSHEIRRGGQVFFVHNRISDIEHMANIIHRLVPDASIGIAHGQMEGKVLEKIMLKFIDGEYDVLVSTNIIESGLDIPNANTIIINRAHMFGLSDLHQMRGRVGRSNTKAYCYLITPPTSGLTSDARKRLSTLEEFSDLGDGFKVAMRDLDIRGAGNLLGSEQSGFISDMGYEMYHKILDEAVSELKETEFKGLFSNDLLKKETLELGKSDCLVETDLELLIPADYVNSTSERLSLYSRLDGLKKEDELKEFHRSVEDRFGPAPIAVTDLIESVKLRWLGVSLGFDKISMKSGKMKCYIAEEGNDDYYQSPIFGEVLQFAKNNQDICRMREYKKKLIITVENIESIEKAMTTLNQMLLVET